MMKGGVKATFTISGPNDITMTMWMAPADNRKVFKALSPANLEYERMPNQPYDIENQPVLTFVARQYGEAWNHPFVAVYEPSSANEPGDIAAVDFFTPTDDKAVGIKITLKDGRVQRYVCKEDGTILR